jgi:putative salt-induced outer membrane protein
MSALLLLTAVAALGPDLPLEVAPPRLPFAPDAPVVVQPMLELSPPAPGLPAPVRTMIEAAYKTGNDKTISDVVGLAKDNFPTYIDEIESISGTQKQMLASVRKEAQEREQARIAAASLFQIWKGELEAGGSRSTGTTRTTSVYASAKLQRDGIRWRQRLNARLDYQETDNERTTERWLVAYQPNYKFNEARYAYGLAQYEHDRFLGIQSRGTFGFGLGWLVASKPNLNITLEAGPALRRTVFIDEANRTKPAGRGSLSAMWAISPTLTFRQDAAVFFEGDDATASSATALETKLLGALKAKFSYNMQFERETPTTSRQLDTVTRATLVYGF